MCLQFLNQQQTTNKTDLNVTDFNRVLEQECVTSLRRAAGRMCARVLNTRKSKPFRWQLQIDMQ